MQIEPSCAVQQALIEAQSQSAGEVAELFDQADHLLFKQRSYAEAKQLYERILQKDARNVDAINSTAYCVKFMAAASNDTQPEDLFQSLRALYQEALSIDPTDIEANFNLGLLYLQFNQDLALALDCFKACVARDDESEEATLYRV